MKKIVSAPQATANSFTYLEFGILPLRYEIHRNQLMFLHHIVHLEDTDPVKVMWENMDKFPEEKNWWSGVKKLLLDYGISLQDVKESSKESYKNSVKKKVKEKALEALKAECKEKKKTEVLNYNTLRPQEYLSHLYPTQAEVIFKSRSKTLAIKDHQRYKHDNNLCRRCGEQDETFDHIVNCLHDDKIDPSVIYEVEDEVTYEMKLQLILIASRASSIIDEFK